MGLLYMCFYLFVTCAQTSSHSDKLDDLDKVMLIMKSKTTVDLVKFFGA